MIHRFQTDGADAGRRLDHFLAERLADRSRGEVRARIDLGGVHIDGRRIRKSGLLLAAGQRLEIHQDNGPLEPFRITSAEVLFQDKYLLVLNKPAGVETQPTLARYRGTLYEALQVWLKRDTRFGRKLEIGMAQRLDRDTSGVIVFSIHPRAHKGLTEQIRDRSAAKHYLALVTGHLQPEYGVWQSKLARDRRRNRVSAVDHGGKEAVTCYRTLCHYQAASLIEVRLETGRTHQIRAQAANAGHPLLGDSRYGGPTSMAGMSLTRQCLHSRRLALLHPLIGAAMEWTAPLPEEMLRLHRLLPGRRNR
jgi:23S rRNA pseudouridine1911/1915/1917 synthase